MLADVLWALGGLTLLAAAGDILVRGAVNLSLHFGVPALLVSLTVVAFGTSAPELLVSVMAVLDGVPGLALGNVVGSNIANVLLVLGLPALVAPIVTAAHDTRAAYGMMLAATALFLGMALLGPIGWPQALVLLAGLGLMIGDALRRARKSRAEHLAEKATLDEIAPGLNWLPSIGFIVTGIVFLPIGAAILLDSATGIARGFGVSETVIGLTLVAVGTSMPELATAVMAAARGRADVVLGNVIGSNLFNILGILGVAGLFGQIPFPPEMFTRDLWVMLAATALLAPMVFWRNNVTRIWGIGLTGAYVAYIYVLIG